ncbi:MAG: hypothetical protein EBZ47_05935 [Chlamydiae bacterium]|nr:hypothetical protein [Chlamydiota bacterium]
MEMINPDVQGAKVFAKESEKTRKAREKLRKKFEEMEKKITPQALEAKVHEIYRWIERHSSQRTVLPSKFSLFDENQNAAELSKKVSDIADQLRRDAHSKVVDPNASPKKILQSMIKSQIAS